MIIGIGTDILNLDHLKPFMKNPQDPFFSATYTEAEQTLIMQRNNPINSYATRFAGKEAVFKCLGIGSNHISFLEIEILETSDGQPTVTLHGKIKELAQQRGIAQILISLSFDTDYAIAYASALSC